jgi:dephospho-CoA kinase
MKRIIIKVGLTGGIGSGKTTVANIFKECGAAVISADLVARGLINRDKNIRKKIVAAFGQNSYLRGGQLNRAWVADQIFKDRRKQKILNSIVHPTTIKEIDKLIKDIESKNQHRVIIVEAALIFEAGVQDSFDYIIVVDANRLARISRMIFRDGKSEKEIKARIYSQISNREKTARADFVIQNDGTLQDLENSTRFLYRLLTIGL